MKWFNGNGTLKRVGLVLTLVAAFTALMWKFDDRVTTMVKAEVKVVKAEATALETRIVASLEKFQSTQDIRHWSQRIQSLTDELYRLRKEIRSNPNDLDLKDSYEYVKEELRKAKAKLESILNQ